MSIFSRKKKAAAVEQAKKAQAEATKPRSAPYFHTPTHAARDFLASTPSYYADHHRAQIMEQQNRRSLMTRTTNERYGKAPASGASTPLPRSSSQISYESMMSDYPPVVTVQRTRPNPFLSASTQQSFETVDRITPIPTIPHRYSSPVVPKTDNKFMTSQRPFSTSHKSAYIRSPLSTSSKSKRRAADVDWYPNKSIDNSSMESDDVSAASSTTSSISSQAPQLELKYIWEEKGNDNFRSHPKPPVHQISNIPPPVPAPLPVSEMPQHLQVPQSRTQTQEEAKEKRERKRRSLFGLGGRRSTVAAV